MTAQGCLDKVREAFAVLRQDWHNTRLADAAEQAVEDAKVAGCSDDEIDAAVRNRDGAR